MAFYYVCGGSIWDLRRIVFFSKVVRNAFYVRPRHRWSQGYGRWFHQNVPDISSSKATSFQYPGHTLSEEGNIDIALSCKCNPGSCVNRLPCATSVRTHLFPGYVDFPRAIIFRWKPLPIRIKFPPVAKFPVEL